MKGKGFLVKGHEKQLQIVTPCEIQDISLAIAQQVKHRYLLLYKHIPSTLRKDFFYMSPTSQNELIRFVAKYIIQTWVKTVKHRFISADEVTSVYVHVNVCMCMCVYVYMCIYILVYIFICIYIYIFVYIFVCIYIHKFIYIYIYIYILIYINETVMDDYTIKDGT